MERNCPSNVPERFGDAYEPRINGRPRRGLWAIVRTQAHVTTTDQQLAGIQKLKRANKIHTVYSHKHGHYNSIKHSSRH
jgi:hypothetical protein